MSDGFDSTSAHDFLMGRINYERTPKAPKRACLERMERLAALLGNPQNELCIVHIAGSKGKGSTATMVAEILQAAGLKVGLYTSPHLLRIEERIAINGEPCDARQFADLVSTIVPAVRQMDEVATKDGAHRGPTFFEIVTAAAWLHFAAAPVDVAVMEVGLGGRLDSTNVCDPAVSVITSISRDHTRQLGDTLAEIAGEKAGIIKPGVPVVSGVTVPAAAAVIERIGAQRDCAVYCLGRDFHYQIDERAQACDADSAKLLPSDDQATGARLDYHDSFGQQLRGLTVGMLGDHQAANAAVAIATIAVLSDRRRMDARCPAIGVDQRSMHQGLASARMPARIEVISNRGGPLVVLDGAHNESSTAALIAALNKLGQDRPAPMRKRLVFATTRGKDTDSMLATLGAWADQLVLTRYVENPRGVPIELLQSKIAELDRLKAEVSSAPTPVQAWQQVWQTAQPNDLICVTGSLFLAAELRERMLADTTDSTARSVAGSL